MNGLPWQEIVAVGVVAAAALYLARGIWAQLANGKGGGCATCDTCPDAETTEHSLVQIGDVRRPRATLSENGEALAKPGTGGRAAKDG